MVGVEALMLKDVVLASCCCCCCGVCCNSVRLRIMGEFDPAPYTCRIVKIVSQFSAEWMLSALVRSRSWIP